MNQLSEESRFILVQFFLVEPFGETPKVHKKKLKKTRGSLLMELDEFIHSYKKISEEIDVLPYEEAAKYVRSIKDEELYKEFLEELLQNYS